MSEVFTPDIGQIWQYDTRSEVVTVCGVSPAWIKVIYEDGSEGSMRRGKFHEELHFTGEYFTGEITASSDPDLREVKTTDDLKHISAVDVLTAAADHMRARASVYDKPTGERSMTATVMAFNAQTGHALSESDGWLLLLNLKIIRDRQREAPHRDSLEDLVAYGALYGESRMKVD